jgi:hypothetical protein
VEVSSGRAVGTYGQTQRYHVTRPRGQAKRDNRRRIQLFGGRFSVTLEILFYIYLGVLAVAVAYKKGWFSFGPCKDGIVIT